MNFFDYDISLEKQLKYLLRQQETLEERIIAQRATMRDISDRFTVLRERAVRSAHSELSLHDLLVVAAYGNTQQIADTSDAKGRATGNPKETYDVFIRSRVLDESCAAPDCATQFHSLTADSLYLLIPHLTNLLGELVCQSQTPAAAATAAAVLISSVSPPLTVSNAAAADAESSAWIARVLRFLELSAWHFPEVLENSEHLLKLQESLAQLWNQQTVVTELRHRAMKLLQQMERRQTDEMM